jgi:site-specific DNA recombinase
MTKAIGYVRVSTQEQVNNGVSLEAQADKIRAYASLYDITLLDIIVDAGESAKSLARVGLQRALEILDTGLADALIVFKLDRLTRSVSDWNTLIADYFGSKALLSVSDQIDTRTAGGRLCLNVLMSVAQWEREAISERTSTALRHKQAQGEHVGSPRYGFKMVAKKLVKVDSEYEAISFIHQLKLNGLSLQAIADHLNLENIRTKREGNWYPTTVKNILDKIV